MGPLSSFNCGIKYLLCVIDVFTKYAWVKPLMDKKVVHGFIEMVSKSKCNQINYGLIREENFTRNLCKTCYSLMIF